jgi:hypothetical protein
MSGSIRLTAALLFTIASVAGLERATHANKNFIPDWTFTGSSLADAEQLGAAKWIAQNGEVIGRPSNVPPAVRLVCCCGSRRPQMDSKACSCRSPRGPARSP